MSMFPEWVQSLVLSVLEMVPEWGKWNCSYSARLSLLSSLKVRHLLQHSECVFRVGYCPQVMSSISSRL